MPGTSAKIKYSFIKIFTGSDLTRRRLPFMSAESSDPGPSVWLTACGHGDEVGGIVIIQELFKKIRKTGLIRGAVYAFPLMNPIGFENVTRHITLSKEDLNRSFPGDKNGSLGERIADTILTTILEKDPVLVLDLHNDWIKSIPYALIDPNPGVCCQEIYDKTRMFIKKTGFLIIRDSETLHKSLSFNLLRKKIPALTLELGESYIVNEKNIEYGVKSVWNILSYLKMTESADRPFAYPLPEIFKNKILTYTDKPFSSSSGIVRFMATPGDVVKKDQPIARVYNMFGKLRETIVALNDSIVLGHSDSSMAFPGMPVMAFGIFGRSKSTRLRIEN
ncbi:Succinylglutamate desuccinylase/aspartoacylase family protein [Desulfonema magnum]|uniref:Succinylglutamate desuccinylase/aspartoacylase family protein n=2 Tax=Desulfonema magnum TaxID=45655 RepID=A0A975GN82_9BACT|nr:Succinylglutamate desuccinylase/aspartoacylase family protein [Desulfonema magnum]